MIVSPQNQRIKNIRRLLRSKGDWTILEGPHLVDEAVRAGLEMETVLATPDFLATPSGRALGATLQSPPLEASGQAIAGLADADSPQGILALVRLPRGGVEGLPVRRGGVYVLAESLQDPGNLGALARTAEAAGAAGLALTAGSASPNHPRALRASAGSLLRLPVAVGAEPEALKRHLESVDASWIALVPRDAADLYASDLPEAIVLLLGAEGPGLSPALLAHADQRRAITLAEPVESLNATVAAALALFEIRRRR